MHRGELRVARHGLLELRHRDLCRVLALGPLQDPLHDGRSCNEVSLQFALPLQAALHAVELEVGLHGQLVVEDLLVLVVEAPERQAVEVQRQLERCRRISLALFGRRSGAWPPAAAVSSTASVAACGRQPHRCWPTLELNDSLLHVLRVDPQLVEVEAVTASDPARQGRDGLRQVRGKTLAACRARDSRRVRRGPRRYREPRAGRRGTRSAAPSAAAAAASCKTLKAAAGLHQQVSVLLVPAARSFQGVEAPAHRRRAVEEVLDLLAHAVELREHGLGEGHGRVVHGRRGLCGRSGRHCCRRRGCARGLQALDLLLDG